MSPLTKARWKGAALGALFWLTFIATVLLGSHLQYGA